MAPQLTFQGRYTSCPLCDDTHLRRDFSISFLGARIGWDRCRSCTLVFQNPRLDENGIRAAQRHSDYFGIHGTSSLSEIGRAHV